MHRYSCYYPDIHKTNRLMACHLLIFLWLFWDVLGSFWVFLHVLKNPIFSRNILNRLLGIIPKNFSLTTFVRNTSYFKSYKKSVPYCIYVTKWQKKKYKLLHGLPGISKYIYISNKTHHTNIFYVYIYIYIYIYIYTYNESTRI